MQMAGMRAAACAGLSKHDVCQPMSSCHMQVIKQGDLAWLKTSPERGTLT